MWRGGGGVFGLCLKDVEDAGAAADLGSVAGAGDVAVLLVHGPRVAHKSPTPAVPAGLDAGVLEVVRKTGGLALG